VASIVFRQPLPRQPEESLQDSVVNAGDIKTKRPSVKPDSALHIGQRSLDSQIEMWSEPLLRPPLLRGLLRAELVEIASVAQVMHFAHREIIFRQDDRVRFVYILSGGMVKVTQLSECGKEVVLRVDRAGSLIDDLADESQAHASTAQTVHACSALVWNAAAFGRFSARFPVIHRNAVSIMQGRLRMLEERFCDISTQRVPQRLARVLLHLARHNASGRLEPIGLSREDLSQMAGTSLFTVSRLLCSWVELDILTVDRKTVVIEDLKRLLQIAETRSDDSELAFEAAGA